MNSTIPVAVAAHADDQSFRTIVDESTPGVLRSIGIAGGEDRHYYRITIDGREILSTNNLDQYFHSALYQGSGGENNQGMGIDFRFSDLEVEIRDAYRSPATRFWVLYELDRAPLSDAYLDELGEDMTTGAFHKDDPYRHTRDGFTYLDLDDHQLLQGRTITARTVINENLIRYGEPIQGRIELLSWDGRTFSNFRHEEYPPMDEVLEPPGFEIRYRNRFGIEADEWETDWDPEDSSTFSLYLPDESPPGVYTVRTDFEQIGNYAEPIMVY